MKQTVLVLAATNYQTVDEQTGAVTNGMSIEYIGDRMEEEGETYSKTGFYPFKENITDVKLASVIDHVPCVCEFTMNMKSNSKDRKPRLVVTGITKTKDFEFKF